MDKEPQTDAEYVQAIAAEGYRFMELGDGFAVRYIKGGGTTRLEATEMSDALFEAWQMVKP